MVSLQEQRTAHLLLRRMGADDFEELDRMHRDPAVMATLGGVRSASQTADFLTQALAHWQQHGFGMWMAHDLQTGRFAGRGGPRHVRLAGEDEVEVGYALMAEFWGRGLATELAAESVRVGFEMLRLANLVCFTLPANYRSRRVMEKVGFVYERDIVHADLPHVLYRLNVSEWQRRTSPPEPRKRRSS